MAAEGAATADTFAWEKHRPWERPSSIGELMKIVMRISFGPEDGDWNLAEPGMLVNHRGHKIRIRLRFAGFLGDAKSHAEVLSLKGSSGRMPCPNCLNCLGRCPRPLIHPYFKRVKDAKASDCVAHTHESFMEVLQRLIDATDAARPSLETKLGVKYEPGSLLFDRMLSRTVIMPYCVFWDVQIQ